MPEIADVIVSGLIFKSVTIPIVSISGSSMIQNKMSDKTKERMRGKQTGQPNSGRQPKDIEALYLGSLHPKNPVTGNYTFPGWGFQKAITEAPRFDDNLKMNAMRQSITVDSEYIDIIGEPQMREDLVKIGRGSADLAYRGEFLKWSAVLPITYNSAAISLEQLVGLVNIAGWCIGVGSWRPGSSAGGMHGKFRIAREGE